MKQHVTVSKMSGKLFGIPSINTSPLENPFCMKSCPMRTNCYSKRMLRTFRSNCDTRWQLNGKYLSEIDISKHPEYAPRLSGEKVVRIHSHGEIINEIHAKNIVNIAKMYPKTTFVLFTHRYDMIMKMGIPPTNLRIMVSGTLDRPRNTVRPGTHGSFNVVSSADKIPEGAFVCHGKCIECMKCYGENAHVGIVYEILK